MTYAGEVWGAATETHSAVRFCLACSNMDLVNTIDMELNIQLLDIFLKKKMYSKYCVILPHYDHVYVPMRRLKILIPDRHTHTECP